MCDGKVHACVYALPPLIDEKKNMCYFPFLNNEVNGKAYKKGVKEFECGACPECLAKRARKWALRASMEAKSNIGCMLTLTYDEYIRNERGEIIGERVADRNVDKKDCQKFIKRLRSYVRYEKIKEYDNMKYAELCTECPLSLGSSAIQALKRYFRQIKKSEQYKQAREDYVDKNSPKIKYLITAEYGKTTHRPHYHALIFGYNFPDRVFYKKSKRGNRIYTSATLNKIWNKGICTVDTVNLNAKTARYCTKYCSKDGRSDDTFMLFSRGIGDENLLKEFNGISYYIDGREYSIPKLIWYKWFSFETGLNLPRYISYRQADEWYGNDKIEVRYSKQQIIIKNTKLKGYVFDFLHFAKQRKRRSYIGIFDKALYTYMYSKQYRAYFVERLESRKIYKRYIAYWQQKSTLYEKYRPNVLTRILQLPNSRYYGYKQSALRCLRNRNYAFKYYGDSDFALPPPRSGCISRYERFYERYHVENGLPFPEYKHKPLQFKYYKFCHAVKNADICPAPLVIKGQMTEKTYIDRRQEFLGRKLIARKWKNENENPFMPPVGQIKMDF